MFIYVFIHRVYAQIDAFTFFFPSKWLLLNSNAFLYPFHAIPFVRTTHSVYTGMQPRW